MLFAVYQLCEARGKSPYDLTEARRLIPDAINIVRTLVKEEMAADETFTTNRYFKDHKTKTQIQQAIFAGAPKKESTKIRRTRTRRRS